MAVLRNQGETIHEITRAPLTEEDHACVQVHNLRDTFHNGIEVLTRIGQGAEELCHRVEGFDMAVVLLESVEEPGILDSSSRLRGKSETKPHIINYPVIRSISWSSDKADDTARSRQRK